MHVAIWYVLHLEHEVKLLFVTESCHGSFRRLAIARGQVRSQASSCGIIGGHNKLQWDTFVSYCFGVSLPSFHKWCIFIQPSPMPYNRSNWQRR